MREGRLSRFRAHLFQVAAVCVYPNLVAIAKDALRGSGVKVASVATAFPSGLSSMAVKLADADALEAGADEIDMVIDRGAFLLGDKNVTCSTRSRR